MATPSAVPTSGTRIYYGDVGSSDPSTLLAEIESYTELPKMEADEYETTCVDAMDGSVVDPFKYFKADKIDPGSLSVKLRMNETQNETLAGLVGVEKKWKVLFVSGAKIVFNGFIKKNAPEANKGADILWDVSVRVSGKPVFTKAPSGG